MARLWRIAISAAGHAAGIAWLATRALAPPPVSAEAALTPIEIMTVAPPPPAVARTAEAARTAAAAPVTSRPGSPPRSPAPAPIEPPGGRATAPANAPRGLGLLAMRHDGAVLPPLRLRDDVDGVPREAGADRERPPASRLRASGGGAHQADQDAFTARVSPDGTVALRDRPTLEAHDALPSPRALGDAFVRWYESDKGKYGTDGDTSMARLLSLDAGPGMPTALVIPVIGGTFDPTDWLMRRNRQDPYAAKKLALLDATRDERVRIGNRHRAERLALTPQIVERNLAALAALPDARARKQALFELWDECAETGEPGVVAGGEAARRLVIGFIRAHLPAGSPDGFTPDELAALARSKRSTARFQPYE